MWCNSIIALTLLLEGSSAFWPFVVILNVLTVWFAKYETKQPESLRDAARSEEPDLAASLRPIALGSSPGSVEDGKAESILVRSLGYSAHKQKQASQQSMYELRRAFTLAAPQSTSKHSHVARSGLDTLGLEAPASSELPQICIVNLQIPDDAPNILQGLPCKTSVLPVDD